MGSKNAGLTHWVTWKGFKEDTLPKILERVCQDQVVGPVAHVDQQEDEREERPRNPVNLLVLGGQA